MPVKAPYRQRPHAVVTHVLQRHRLDRIVETRAGHVEGYPHKSPTTGSETQHAVASSRHFACNAMPHTIAARPIAISNAPSNFIVLVFCRRGVRGKGHRFH
jgi:hypothetical protein